MFLKKLTKEIESSAAFTLGIMYDIPEEIIYSLKKTFRREKNKGKNWMFNSDLLDHAKKPQTPSMEEQTNLKSYEPDMGHLTDYQKKTSKVPPGFTFKSACEVAVEPIEKKYKKKNPYRPED